MRLEFEHFRLHLLLARAGVLVETRGLRLVVAHDVEVVGHDDEGRNIDR